MTGSRTRAQRRARERAMQAAGVALVTRRHLPAGVGAHPARLAILVSDCLDELDAKGGDLGSMVAITIGQHPEYPGETTVEAKVAAMKPDASIVFHGRKQDAPDETHSADCVGCPIDHSADNLDE